VGALLDAVGFDWGATHIELMLTDEGPRLVEINPRLVGAKIPRLVSQALGRSMHADLIAVHLGQAPARTSGDAPADVGVIRWIVASRPGPLAAIQLPERNDARIRCVEILKQPGEPVGPPFENADRIGYVMVCDRDRQAAEQLADRFVAQSVVELQGAVRAEALVPAC
jgi:biotin carboxylase